MLFKLLAAIVVICLLAGIFYFIAKFVIALALYITIAGCVGLVTQLIYKVCELRSDRLYRESRQKKTVPPGEAKGAKLGEIPGISFN